MGNMLKLLIPLLPLSLYFYMVFDSVFLVNINEIKKHSNYKNENEPEVELSFYSLGMNCVPQSVTVKKSEHILSAKNE